LSGTNSSDIQTGSVRRSSLVRRASFYVAYHLYAKRKIRRIDHTSLFGLSITVPPTVFHPGLYFSSKALARYVSTIPLAGKHVLDMGCGSGIIGLVAASHGATVTAVDLNAKAVEATRHNADRNGFTSLITAFQSNLFESIPDGMRFDVIFWNPPFYPIAPRHEAGLAWNAGENHDVIREFSRSAMSYLVADGFLVIILSTDAGVTHVLNMFLESGYEPDGTIVIPHLFERFLIIRFRGCAPRHDGEEDAE